METSNKEEDDKKKAIILLAEKKRKKRNRRAIIFFIVSILLLFLLVTTNVVNVMITGRGAIVSADIVPFDDALYYNKTISDARFVPYQNATANVNLTGHNLTADNLFGNLNYSYIQNSPTFLTTNNISNWSLYPAVRSIDMKNFDMNFSGGGIRLIGVAGQLTWYTAGGLTVGTISYAGGGGWNIATANGISPQFNSDNGTFYYFNSFHTLSDFEYDYIGGRAFYVNSTNGQTNFSYNVTTPNLALIGNCGANTIIQNITTAGVQCVPASSGNVSWNQSFADSLYLKTATENATISRTGNCGPNQVEQNDSTTGPKCVYLNSSGIYNVSYDGSINNGSYLSTFNATYNGIVENTSYRTTFNTTYDGLINNASYLSTFNSTVANMIGRSCPSATNGTYPNGSLICVTVSAVEVDPSWNANSSLGIALSLKAPSGAVNAPSYTFSTDTSTGLSYNALYPGFTTSFLGVPHAKFEYYTYPGYAFDFFLQNRSSIHGWIKDSYVSLGGESISDIGMGGLYDKNELTQAGIVPNGNIAVDVTNATYTNTQTEKEKLVDASPGNYLSLSNVNTTATMIVTIDMGRSADNFGSATWYPFVQYRLSVQKGDQTSTFFQNVSVEVSNDNATWFSSAVWNISGFDNYNQVPGYVFMGGAFPGIVNWRYAKFRFKDPFISNYSLNTSLWMSELGIRHPGTVYARQFLSKEGGEVYGQTNITKTLGVQALSISNNTNQGMNRCTLVSGVCVVPNTRVTTNTNIFCFEQTQGGTIGSIGISGRNAGVNYTVSSSNVLDTSIVACMLIEPTSL